MKALQSVQTEFFDNLLCDSNADLAFLTPSARPFFQIYRNAYIIRLAEALKESYPILYRWIGHETFAELARSYIHRHPSKYYNIRDFGDHFAAHIAEQKHPRAWEEMATFEWMLKAVFDQADVTPMEETDLHQIAPEHWPAVVFSRHPFAATASFGTNVPRIWQALSKEQSAPPIEKTVQIPWLFWRHGLKTMYRSMDEDQWFCWQSLENQQTFAELCAGLFEKHGDNAALIAATFVKTMVEDGLLSGYELSL